MSSLFAPFEVAVQIGTYASRVVSDGAVGYWRLNERGFARQVMAFTPAAFWRMGEASGNLADSGGNGLTATKNGSPTYGIAGPVADGSTAVHFNGVDSYYNCGDNNNFDFAGTTAHTIAFTIRVAGVPATVFERILSKEATDGSGQQGWAISVAPATDGSPGTLLWNRWLNGANDVRSSVAAMTLSSFLRVVCTYDGTTMRMFINGVQQGAGTASSKSVVNHAIALNIGKDSRSSSGFLTGDLKDTFIVNGRALSQAEIAADFAAFAETDSTVSAQAADSSGNARHGVYVAGPLLGSSGALSDGTTAATMGSATACDVNVPHNAALTPTAALSLEAWVNPSAQTNVLPRLVERIIDDGSGNTGYRLRINNVAPFEISMEVFTSAGVTRSLVAAAALPAGAMHHVVATYDGQWVRISVDGAQVAANNFGSVAAIFYGSSQVVLIGNNSSSGGTRPFAGTIDEVALYPSALSALQIKDHYRRRTLDSAGWTDITADVAKDPITIRHGIQGTGVGDRVASTGTASFSLKNDTGNSGGLLGFYSLHHANARPGWTLNVPCRIRLQDPATSTWRTRFIGKVDVIDVHHGQYGRRRVDVTAVDWMDEAARWTLVPEIGEQLGKRGDQILTNILARMPVQPTATSFDQGREAYPYALDTSSNSNQPALSEFANLASSEFGYIYIKADGTLRYEGRHTRVLTTSSAWTIGDSTLVPSQDGLASASGRDAILNTIRVTAHPKIVDPAATTIVYDQANVIRISPGETKTLLGEYRDPITGDAIGATEVQTPVAGTDYIANSLESGGGAVLTANISITLNAGPSGARFAVQNTGTVDAYLMVLQLRGKGIYDRGSVDAEARDAASVSTYGARVASFDMPYQADIRVAQGLADYTLTNESIEAARAQAVRVLGRDSATLTQVLLRDISDRVTVTETVTGFNAAFFINAVELTVLPNGYVTGTYTLARIQQAAAYWVLGTSTLGTDTTPAPF